MHTPLAATRRNTTLLRWTLLCLMMTGFIHCSDGGSGTDSNGSSDSNGDSDAPADTGAHNNGGSTDSDSINVPGSSFTCSVDGDGISTLVFVNQCASLLSLRGTRLDDVVIPIGGHLCHAAGNDTEPLSSLRYWGFLGDDPGMGRHTLAEMTLNTDFHDFDWYNISHVDAHNLPMRISPIGRPNCPSRTCADDLLPDCPPEGRFFQNDQIVSCVSPDRDDPDNPVALYFDASCTEAYSWSQDDADSMAACAGEDYEIVFCPSAALTAPYPVDPSDVTRGGTITFSNIGAPGWWPRRLNLPNGNPACDYKDGTDTWGGVCCMEMHHTATDRLSPFDEEMTLILKAVDIKQLAVYQPAGQVASNDWERVSFFDRREDAPTNFTFTKSGNATAVFDGDLTRDDCVWYVMQQAPFDCDNWNDYYCPRDPGINHLGWSGSKLIGFLGSMTFDDSNVQSCSGDGSGHPGPWVAFVASELTRDGARKWNGLCNCYSKTGTVGDGCGEINVFEVVMDNNEWSNREFISTGVRSYQNGHVGGSVCGSSCHRDAFPPDADVVNACGMSAYDSGPQVVSGGSSDGCPVWRRPIGDRFFFILLDEERRMIQVGILHPDNLPAAAGLLPLFPEQLPRTRIDDLLNLRIP